MEYPPIEKLNSNTCTEKYIKSHYFDFWNYLYSKYSDELIWGEKLYWFYNDIIDYPKCPVCGKKPGFLNFKLGYKTYCCVKCSNNDPNKKLKTKQTCLKKYGGNAPASSQKIKEKSKQTCLKKYGVENAQQLESIREKTKQTHIEKYGGIGNQSNELKRKYKQTSLEKYGVENPMQNIEVKENFKLSMLEKHNVDHPSRLKSIKLKIVESFDILN